MTLSDMATFVCRKVRQTDTTSIARCKEFLARRYEMIWNEELWKDSIFGYDFTTAGPSEDFAPGTLEFLNGFSFAHGAWLFPSVVDRVLALRSADTALPVENEMAFYRQDFNAYTETGTAVRFVQLPRICAYASNYADDASSANYTQLITNSSEAGQLLKITYIDHQGERVSQTITLGPAQTITVGPVRELLKLTKPVTEDPLILIEVNADGYWFEFEASKTTVPLRCRIRLLPKPTEPASYKALVKLKPQALDDDSEEPQISGVENCLLAFAQGDMLERARRYGQAQAKFEEGLTLLNQLKKMAVVQEAIRSQITPDVTEASGQTDWRGGKGWI